MGGGASTSAANATTANEMYPADPSAIPAWLEASELTDAAALKAEVVKLRALVHSHMKSQQEAEAKPVVQRAAVMDKQEKIDVSNYKKLEFPKEEAMLDMLKIIMEDNILFRNCKSEEKVDILDAFEPVEFKRGEYVINQGEDGQHFFAVWSGSLKAYINKDGTDLHVASYGQGKSFGELALMYNTPRAASVKAEDDCVLLRIDRTTFRKIVLYFQLERQKKYIGFVSEVSIQGKKLKELISSDQLSQLASALEVEYRESGDTIIRQGEMGDFFYIIETGNVEIIKDGAVVSELSTGGIFGELALLKEDKRAATVQASSAVKLLALGREDFVAMLGSVTELGGSAGVEEEDPMFAAAEGTGSSETISGDSLTVIRTLGCGAFGRVKLAEHKATGTCYALKCQAKSAIIENCLQDHILNERKILMQLDHQFILKIHDAYQDDAQIYFVLELLLGGELFTHLRSKKSFAEKEAKFYAAQVLLAFQHIHKKKIAYRDLKPENLVLTTDGYIKIVDFGLAKVVDGKTWTLCGTPDYLAPEIILNEGHDKAVDYWALGVLIYEMVAGEPPFYADDPMEVYEKILSATMQIPTRFSKNLSDIVRKLLKIYQSKRLGNGKGGCSAIVKHKWFYGFDWELLLTKSLPLDAIPIVPKVKDQKDASMFDNYNDEEDAPPPPPDQPWNPSFD